MVSLVLMLAPVCGEMALAGPAEDIINTAQTRGGLVVHIGCGPKAAVSPADLRASDSFVVHALARDPEHVAKVRKQLLAKRLYGPVSVDLWDGGALPYRDNLVNLIVIEDGVDIPPTEIARVLSPLGVAMSCSKGKWLKTVNPRSKQIDDWTHYLHGADGNPVAADTVVGPPRQVQWLAGPLWARHHDHMASMTSLVSTGGRVFYIFDEGLTASIQLPSRWRLIARDAFNGTLLWKRTIDKWNTRQYPLKSGPAHLLRRLVAVGDRVYVTLGIDAAAMALDAATGKTIVTFKDSQHTREIVVDRGAAFLVADSARSRLPDFRRKSSHVWKNMSKANSGWGWNGDPRRILACDAGSGKGLWKVDSPVAPCSLAVDGKYVVFHDGKKLVCLDRKNGSVLWKTAAPIRLPVPSSTGPRVLIYKDVVLFAPGRTTMSGWSVKDGKKLWEQKHQPSGHNSLKDLYVIDGLVWTGNIASGGGNGVFIGYDVVTGKKRKEYPCDVKPNWFHHRCYPAKATSKYILAARNGTEYIDLQTGHWDLNHWVRGGCIYGVMPCNGLTYAPMDACGCQLEAKLAGFKALAPGPVVKPTKAQLSEKARLQKGPAYAKAAAGKRASSNWPTYRHDGGRSGATTASVAPGLKQAWKTRLGGRLSAVTVAGGRLVVSSIDTHTVHALDEKTGRSLWSYTAGGRVDSPPSYYRGLLFFGSADGYVYALRASDGAEAWRFRAAPVDRRVEVMEQIESAWPVHGSVLIHDDVIYCTAGRSMFLDGGIRFLRLKPATGKLLGEEVMDSVDPVSGKGIHEAYVKPMPGNNMPVALSDVLSCDGKNIWMRSQKFAMDGKRLEIKLQDVKVQPPDEFHLFCQIGFLDDSYFFRSYWSYGRRVTGGYGSWFKAGRLIPSGRILCFDDKRVYGFGRKPQYMLNASVLEYEMFAADKKPRLAEAKAWRTSSDWRALTMVPRKSRNKIEYKWTIDQPSVISRAMVVAGDNIFFAGPPNLINERKSFRFPDDKEVRASLARQVEAFEGKRGAQLWAVSKDSGKLLCRYALDSPPVFDGMAAVKGRLFAATVDGHVICFSPDGTAKLPSADDQPLTTTWDQPEDPVEPIKRPNRKKKKSAGGKRKKLAPKKK
jgi:outer membrane protein assembly factor BamB